MSDAQPPRPKRVNRFDRPPPPHDWRWWVGGLGRTLIATGLLLFGFVAYQLWGTGIETARAQNSLENEFEELLATTPPPAIVAPTSTTPAATTPSSAVPDTTAPDTAVPDTTVPLPPIAEGDAIARIEMPRIGVDKIVVAGVSTSALKKGPGHYPETPMPGQLGNSAIAGHRTTFGQPFYDIDKMRDGDEIIVTTIAGRFVYRVTGQQIVSSSDYHVIATTDPTRATLTLTSCHPKYTARDRIIVTADLDVAASTGIVGDPTLNYGRPIDDRSDDTEPTNTVTDATVTDTDYPVVSDPETPTVSVDGAGEGTDDPTGDAGGALDDDRIDAGIADAFSEGWFSDPDAYGQVALWGLLLAAIAVGSYLLGRSARRLWVGLVVGVGPFVVTLYFFYQNVNRLLPPGL